LVCWFGVPQIRAHEVAIAELDNLNPSRVSLFPCISLPCLRILAVVAKLPMAMFQKDQITNGNY
jgi:hypothetical protein